MTTPTKRALRWWYQYSGSVAFVSLIVVMAYGFWYTNRVIERNERVHTLLIIELEKAQNKTLFRELNKQKTDFDTMFYNLCEKHDTLRKRLRLPQIECFRRF